MDLELSEDQRELWAVARQMLDDAAPLRVARAFLEGAGDGRALAQSLADLGWYAVGTDEDTFGVPGLCLLAEQIGAHAAPTSLVDTAVAVRIARGVEDPSPLVRSIGAGELPTALAVLEPGAGWIAHNFDTVARRHGEGFVLDGTKVGVQHAESAGGFAVVAEHDGALGVFFVSSGGPGISIAGEGGLDAASAPATVTLTNAPVEPGCALTGEVAPATVAAAFSVGALATAAEGIGAASAALDMAIDYARERRQFGRPIGQFQALQHVLADAHIDRESAWSSILFAAAAVDEGLPEADEATSIAKAYTARAGRAVIEAALQVLGGIAFTWEHDVHLLQRRVLSCERRFGDAAEHERVLGDMLAERVLEPVS
jgi:alkylation response protein AidB-like acyl-CoA dehydrogenase